MMQKIQNDMEIDPTQKAVKHFFDKLMESYGAYERLKFIDEILSGWCVFCGGKIIDNSCNCFYDDNLVTYEYID